MSANVPRFVRSLTSAKLFLLAFASAALLGCEARVGGTTGVGVELSGDATLSGLSPSVGTLSPAFASSTVNYTVNVSNATTSITFVPVASRTASRITVNGATVASGTASAPITLALGNNPVSIVVTAPNGESSLTYAIVVNRSTV